MRQAGEEAMTDRQLRDKAMTVLIAGHDGCQRTGMDVASSRPTRRGSEAPGRDCRSIGRAPPQVDDLPHLRYARAVLEEALRLYPPAWIITRKALADDESWAAGCRPMRWLSPVPTSLTGRQPVANPDAFDPDRFTEERAAGRPRFAYYPFGGGPRLCIGDQFALTEAKLVIAAVAQRCRLVPCPATRSGWSRA